MSTDISTIKNTGKDDRELNLNQFWGGESKGTMLQLTQGLSDGPDVPGFIQLTPRDAYVLIGELAEWLKSVAVHKMEGLKTIIAENESLKKTVFQDAVDCEHYIAELRVLEIPLRLLGMAK